MPDGKQTQGKKRGGDGANDDAPLAVNLTEHEEESVQERLAPRAAVLFETVRREGAQELERPVAALTFSGLAAGLSMGFSLVGTAVLRAALPAGPWRGLIESLGYTLGFLIVVLGRQQLFTENTVTAILPLLDSPHRLRRLGQVARLWAIVLVANVVGTVAFAYTVESSDVFPPALRATFLALGREAASGSFETLFLRAIFAGWLIALMVWVLPGAENAKAFAIVVITYLVGAAGFAHIIAGSVEVLTTVAAGERTWSEYFTGFFVPVLLGNCVGGIALVSLLNYGQVAPEVDDRRG